MTPTLKTEKEKDSSKNTIQSLGWKVKYSFKKNRNAILGHDPT